MYKWYSSIFSCALFNLSIVASISVKSIATVGLEGVGNANSVAILARFAINLTLDNVIISCKAVKDAFNITKIFCNCVIILSKVLINVLTLLTFLSKLSLKADHFYS